MTARSIKEIEAAVDVAFLKGRPALKPGSPKWVGVRKWGWYVGSFQRICTAEFAFQCSPAEYLDAWEQRPRMMAIYEVIQARMRRKQADKYADMETKAKANKSSARIGKRR